MLPTPECESGYPWCQIQEILGVERTKELSGWMYGQTMTMCDGRQYNHDTREYEESCGGVGHGGVVYTWDLQRFLDGRPVID